MRQVMAPFLKYSKHGNMALEESLVFLVNPKTDFNVTAKKERVKKRNIFLSGWHIKKASLKLRADS